MTALGTLLKNGAERKWAVLNAEPITITLERMQLIRFCFIMWIKLMKMILTTIKMIKMMTTTAVMLMIPWKGEEEEEDDDNDNDHAAAADVNNADDDDNINDNTATADYHDDNTYAVHKAAGSL
jgi:hypothetical protein